MKSFRKLILLFLIVITLLSMMSILSCSREATFEDIVISSEIDDDYNAPIYPRDEYVLDKMKGKIYIEWEGTKKGERKGFSFSDEQSFDCAINGFKHIYFGKRIFNKK